MLVPMEMTMRSLTTRFRRKTRTSDEPLLNSYTAVSSKSTGETRGAVEKRLEIFLMRMRELLE